MQEFTDKTLLQKIQQGNKFAFDNLFFKYYQPLYRFAFNIYNDPVIADESVQNAFIKIWNRSNSLNPGDEVIKLLFTYTKNEVIDEIRKINTRKKYEQSAVIEVLVNDENALDEKYIIKALIESGIDKLPNKAKEIFRLAKQEGLTIDEIANFLKISRKTVENQLSIAYKKMRLFLEPYKNQLLF